MKKGLLFQYNQELDQMQNSVIYHINRGRIADFYKENRVYIQSILDDIRTIQKAYFTFDENDRIVFSGEGNDRKPVFVEGKSDIGYQKQWDILMAQNVYQKFVMGDVAESVIVDGKEVIVPVEPMH